MEKIEAYRNLMMQIKTDLEFCIANLWENKEVLPDELEHDLQLIDALMKEDEDGKTDNETS